MQDVWSQVQFTGIGPDPGKTVSTGASFPLEASIELAGLRPEDVRVEAVVGRIGVTGQLEDTQVILLPPVRQNGSVITFGREYTPHLTGRLGYALRIEPNHSDDPLTRPCYSLLRWS